MANGLLWLLRRSEEVSSRLGRGVVLCMLGRHFLPAKFSRLLVPSMFSRYSLLAKLNDHLPFYIYSTMPYDPHYHPAVRQNERRFYSLSNLYHIIQTKLALTQTLPRVRTSLVA